MVKTVFGDLGLSLNEEKSKVADARTERFDFLGFTTRLVKNPRTDRKYPLIRPSRKAIKHIRAEIKGLTMRRNLSIPKDVVL